MFKNYFKKSNKVENNKQKDLNYQDLTEGDFSIIEKVKPYTMTSIERIKTLLDSVEYINKYQIEGDFVECGAWRGGSVMAMLLKLISVQNATKRVWVFDTFMGMSEPSDIDRDLNNHFAIDLLDNSEKNSSDVWAYSTLEETSNNILSVGYPTEKVHFIQGMVEDTLPINKIDKISLLRLDTDWYESTKIELEFLFPKLVSGGILIIDDYGHWKGCQKAVDEYFEKIQYSTFLSRIDYTGRILVKK